MGFLSSISSVITSSVISNSESEKQAGSAKGELFPDVDATVERLNSFDLEVPIADKGEVKRPSQSTRIKKK